MDMAFIYKLFSKKTDKGINQITWSHHATCTTTPMSATDNLSRGKGRPNDPKVFFKYGNMVVDGLPYLKLSRLDILFDVHKV
jgi:hypothetical protein